MTIELWPHWAETQFSCIIEVSELKLSLLGQLSAPMPPAFWLQNCRVGFNGINMISLADLLKSDSITIVLLGVTF